MRIGHLALVLLFVAAFVGPGQWLWAERGTLAVAKGEKGAHGEKGVRGDGGARGEKGMDGKEMNGNETHGTKLLGIATFAGGCFWCMQPPFDSTPGVVSTRVGYAGGKEKNPTYEQVSTGKTGHVEAVLVTYDPEKVTYEKLLDVFWRNIDPTQGDGQFADRGPQYKTEIIYHNEDQRRAAEKSKQDLQASSRFSKPIATEIVPATEFYEAEEYHQDYYKKSASHYKLYKVGSGRAGFIEKTWGKDEKAEAR